MYVFTEQNEKRTILALSSNRPDILKSTETCIFLKPVLLIKQLVKVKASLAYENHRGAKELDTITLFARNSRVTKEKLLPYFFVYKTEFFSLPKQS